MADWNLKNSPKYISTVNHSIDVFYLCLFDPKLKVVTNLCFKYLLSNSNIFDCVCVCFFLGFSRPFNSISLLDMIEWNTCYIEGSTRYNIQIQETHIKFLYKQNKYTHKSLHQLMNTTNLTCSLIQLMRMLI